jgi:hypothetical protein
MLITASALLMAAVSVLRQGTPTSVASGSPALIRRSPVAVTRNDSVRAVRLAHRAQGDFEFLRRRLLPPTMLVAGGGCDAVVGRYCYLQQVASSAPPEAPEVVAARRRLLVTLDSLGAMVPGDRWIVGQKIRYLVETGKPQAADSTAVACAASATVAATRSWCLALVGYTAQQFGNYTRADAAFTSALAGLSESERWKWEDLARVVGRGPTKPYKRAEGEPRDSMTAAFWRLVQPLYLRNVNDLRTEFLARVTRMFIEQDSRTVLSDWSRPDDRETLLRYGVALWYTQGERPRGSLEPPPIAGIRRVPAFNFFPDGHVFASPEQLSPDDWQLLNVESRPTYAPIWATSFQPLIDHQVALFRRGDSAFIVAAFAVNDDAAFGKARRAGMFAALIDSGGVLPPIGKTIENAGLTVVSTLTAPWRPMVISLEVLDSADRAAGRMRFAPKLPESGTRLNLSDLLLYAPRDSAPKSLADAVPLALNALVAPINRQIGIFWEAYGVRPEGETFDYAISVERIDRGLMHRALVKLHVQDPDRTLNLHWREVPSVSGSIASRGVTVDLSRLEPGVYRVRLTLTSGAELPIAVDREIEIL